MWHQWFNRTPATLVITDDAVLLRESGGDTVLVDQAPDLPEIEQCLRQHREKLKGKRLTLVLAGSWVRMLVLPWQDHLHRREDWEAIGQRALQKVSVNDSEHWFCRVSLMKYGKPVLVMGIYEKLHQLLMTLAAELKFEWKQIKPLNTLLLNKYTDVEKLIVAEPGLVTIMQLAHDGLEEVQLLKPPVGQELSGIQQYLARVQILSRRTNQLAKAKVIVSAALKQDWSELTTEQANIAVIQGRGELVSHAHWVVEQSV